jgi:hypothetical protein
MREKSSPVTAGVFIWSLVAVSIRHRMSPCGLFGWMDGVTTVTRGLHDSNEGENKKKLTIKQKSLVNTINQINR